MTEQLRCVEKSARTDKPCRVRNCIELDPDGQPRCHWHSTDPERRATAQRKRKRGGNVSRPGKIPRAPKNIEDAKNFLAWVMNAAAAGKITHQMAKELGTLADKFLAACDQAETDAELKEMKASVQKILNERSDA